MIVMCRTSGGFCCFAFSFSVLVSLCLNCTRLKNIYLIAEWCRHHGVAKLVDNMFLIYDCLQTQSVSHQ